MLLSQLVAEFRTIKKEFGDIEICINNCNVIENITVISRTSGNIVSLSGSIYRVHPIIAQGTGIRVKTFRDNLSIPI